MDTDKTLLDLPRDIFVYTFQNNCLQSTFYILSMTCRYFHSSFNIEMINYSHVFLKEDNILWFRNIRWNSTVSDILKYGRTKCLTTFVMCCDPPIPTTKDELTT